MSAPEPIALVDRHTNCRDPKKANRSNNTNSHKPVSAKSNIVDVGIGRGDLIQTRHSSHHLVNAARETKPKEKTTETDESPFLYELKAKEWGQILLRLIIPAQQKNVAKYVLFFLYINQWSFKWTSCWYARAPTTSAKQNQIDMQEELKTRLPRRQPFWGPCFFR